MRKFLMVGLTTGAMMLAVAAPALAAEPGQDWQEYQCSPGILGTGIACNSAPAPGPAPEDDVFQGGPLGADSAAAEALRSVLGGELLRG